ncbi:aminoacyl-tRNA hydrolase [Ostreibacterium oceani]|uniref:Peptidyl-tRNA hydrolase n=1 Tax=Ostreibacterium oceani TaxID=2654998 RepID=A0A6N7EVU8_9GAMM|nr:aminoacyl-tRNA hydrolase [Ostreibacterium oceani]MPV85549.1 aminoacyl-tRNA hydrolase [Ostreibacterium oceani]
MSNIKLVVGLGNPGEKYAKTRHNAGFWFLEQLTPVTSFSFNKTFNGEIADAHIGQHKCYLFKPTTFMNLSGDAVQRVMQFYKITAPEMLVAHDELDFPAGTCRLKKDGGHGGHNGLRDIINKTGNANFMRLRIGIDHPGHASQVAHYVLKSPGLADKTRIDNALIEACNAFNVLLSDGFDAAVQQLHQR